MCVVVHFFLLSLFSQTSVRTPSVATPTILTVVKGSVLSSAISILSKHENLLYMSSEPIMTSLYLTCDLSVMSLT